MKENLINVKKIMYHIFKNEPRLLILSIVLSALLGILPIVGVFINKILFNSIQSNEKVDEIVIIFLSLMVYSIIAKLLIQYSEYINEITESRLSYKINYNLLKKTLNLSLRDYEDSKTYDNLQRAEGEAAFRPYLIFKVILSTITNIMSLVFATIILVKWKWWISIIIVLLPVMMIKHYKKISKKEKEIYVTRTKFERKAWYINFLLTKDQSIKEIKIFGLGKELVEKFLIIKEYIFSKNIEISKKKIILNTKFQIVCYVIVMIINGLAIWEGVLNIILIGTILEITKATSITENSIKSITSNIYALNQSGLYSKYLLEFIELEEINGNEEDEELTKIESIEFKNVSYRYKDKEKFALKNINLVIKKGETVLLIGRNGSGKSTLIKILSGLYDEYEGEILINNINMKKFSRESVMKHIGVVFQDFIQYQESVKENIHYGDINRKSENKEIIEAAMIAGADKFIDKLKDRYEQRVGSWFEGGLQLSGGEWQKLALARAFYRNADMYLLDEASSALDPVSEKELYEKMKRLTQDRIGIIITHKLLKYKVGNRILVLKQGDLVEDGNHEELIKKEGEYYSIYNSTN
ncbi:MAG: ABC transporter ATP-binding protein [Clostridium sp.]|uniref:ABC transporter ATP-binding protein n=1 Tax=Clostridium sp. TaxID=1506 RepID=UPI003EE5514F